MNLGVVLLLIWKEVKGVSEYLRPKLVKRKEQKRKGEI